MTWLAAHWVALMSGWMVVHVIAQSVHAKDPDSKTAIGRLASFWSAVNPLDVVKAFKAFGSELTLPITVLCMALIGGLMTAACVKQAPPPETPTLDAARMAEHSAATALFACLATTGVADRLAGENSAQITVDEIRTCLKDAGDLITAAVRLHAAERAALATLADAGADR